MCDTPSYTGSEHVCERVGWSGPDVFEIQIDRITADQVLTPGCTASVAASKQYAGLNCTYMPQPTSSADSTTRYWLASDPSLAG